MKTLNFADRKSLISHVEELVSMKVSEGAVTQLQACAKSGLNEYPDFFFSLDPDDGSISLLISLVDEYGEGNAELPLMQATKQSTGADADKQSAIKEAEALEAVALHLRQWADSK